MRLSGKSALVTGAGAGIGRQIAIDFARQGAYVFVADVNREAAERTAEDIIQTGGQALSLAFDVADADGVAQAYRQVSEAGALHIQVSTAGITSRASFFDATPADFEHVWRVNVLGTFLCGQASARIMRGHGGGRILNFSSISGQFGGTDRIAYGATKAAIINMTQTMAVELGEHAILVNAIAPGPTRVERTRHDPEQAKAFLRHMPLARYGEPSDIANAALFLCSDDNAFITGHTLNVDGGFGASGVVY
jgi:NAD(P)-dependent dehydrogenase (short-subunit alcohol dehydrogenase family)